MTDQQEKSEQATPYKLEEARKKGQVARSQELLSFMMLFAFLLVFSACVYRLASVLATHSHWWLGNAGWMQGDWGGLMALGKQSLGRLLQALLPVFAVLILVAIMTNLLFNGVVFSAAPLKPDFKRLNPIQGLKRMFSRRMLVELLKVLAKGLLFALVLFQGFQAGLPVLLASGLNSPLLLPATALELLVALGFVVLAVMGIAALFDIWYSRKAFARQMRMSRRELKDEYKRREGDPEIRSRRKTAQQTLLQKTAALGKVKDADVIITNPNRYAIALQYRPALMRAPLVLAMGRGVLAWRIRSLARRHRVPLLRRPALARALYGASQLNQPIADELQKEVARVYRWVIAIPGNRVVL